MTRTTAVDFERPPVNEVVCGVVFEALPWMSTAHLGLLWAQYGEEFPQTQDRLPIGGPTMSLAVVDGQPVPPPARVWFVSEDDRRLVQVQRDRFHFNWRRRDPSDEYPRFEAVYAAFRRHLDGFRDFVGQLGDFVPTQLELTYINVIEPRPDGPTAFAGIFRDQSWTSASLPAPTSFHRTEVVEAGPPGARLRIVRRSMDTKEGKPATYFELTVSGPVGDAEADLDKWFDVAHEAVVNTFVDLTGDSVQIDAWGRMP